MAPDKKDKKRKAAVATDSPAKKTKKQDVSSAKPKDNTPKPAPKKADKGVEKTKKNAAETAAQTNGQSARQRRRGDCGSLPAEKKAGNKKSKKEESAPAGKKAASKAKKAEEVAGESDESDVSDDEDFLVDSAASDDSEDEEEDIDEDDEEDEEAEDDQTAALIKGFESSGDEDDSGDEGFEAGKPVPRIPDSKKIKQKLLKKQKKNAGTQEEPGTVYIGRIPHGFYEHEMRAYFSQFGEITRLRLSRNRITGRSKHYAFVEFNSVTVAKIVAETMDNYLMYGHILKCKFVPSESLHPEVWKGANRRFKKTPWNRIEKKRLEKGKTREQWAERIAKEQKKRLSKAKKLKDLGYEFNLPQLKAVEDVPVQEPKAVEAAETPAETETPAEEPVKAVEAPPAKEDTPKKAKKGKKADQETKEATVTDSPVVEKKKAKKAGKAKVKA
ncbi:rRNA processing protein gar2 [Penicillium hetheringtonii]|uniref:rRNA processing protein gar2 n=1 Tax=Penicillium hetheringtonii TaxID=911720 RepID=A0AAD6GNM1_9EURO|nr:rRNA processing protein gar2 [Penicillium hetheringtonii]